MRKDGSASITRPLINPLIKIINFLVFHPGGKGLLHNSNNTPEISQVVLQQINRYCLMISIQMVKLMKTKIMKMIQLSYRTSGERCTKLNLFVYCS